MPRPVLLTIDDDPEVLKSIERDLRKHYAENYRILTAGSGQAALDLIKRLDARNEPIALFLVDHRMPQMNGIEFLAQAMRTHPEPKRVLLTAYADTDAAIRAINEVKLNHYLLKPWDPPEQHLYPVLDDLLGNWKESYRPPFEGIRVLGTRWSSKSYEMRDFLARNQVPYQWLDAEAASGDGEGRRIVDSMQGADVRLPIVMLPDGEKLIQPSTGEVAARIGLQTKTQTDFHDVVILGGGPAGLAAAVYGASEGLSTVVVEREAPGGQAGLSSAIENYLGFPAGLTRRRSGESRSHPGAPLRGRDPRAPGGDGPARRRTLPVHNAPRRQHARLPCAGHRHRRAVAKARHSGSRPPYRRGRLLRRGFHRGRFLPR